MNLMRFKLVTADVFVINSEIVLDASKLVESYVVGGIKQDVKKDTFSGFKL